MEVLVPQIVAVAGAGVPQIQHLVVMVVLVK
jgi:hypothetical protein